MVKRIVREKDVQSKTKKTEIYKKTGQLAQYNFSQREINKWVRESNNNSRGETSLLIDQIIDAACKCASYQSMGAFSYFENEDLYYATWQCCIEVLRSGKYRNPDGDRSLYGFLHAVAINKILNFKRDNVWNTTVQKSNKYCQKCPHFSTCNRKVYMADYNTAFDCAPRRELQRLNQRKYLIGHSFEMTMDSDDNTDDNTSPAGQDLQVAGPRFQTDDLSEDNEELVMISKIMSHLPEHLKEHLQTLITAQAASTPRRTNRSSQHPNRSYFLRTLFKVIEQYLPDNDALLYFIKKHRVNKHNNYQQSEKGKRCRNKWWKKNGIQSRKNRHLLNFVAFSAQEMARNNDDRKQLTTRKNGKKSSSKKNICSKNRTGKTSKQQCSGKSRG